MYKKSVRLRPSYVFYSEVLRKPKSKKVSDTATPRYRVETHCVHLVGFLEISQVSEHKTKHNLLLMFTHNVLEPLSAHTDLTPLQK